MSDVTLFQSMLNVFAQPIKRLVEITVFRKKHKWCPTDINIINDFLFLIAIRIEFI